MLSLSLNHGLVGSSAPHANLELLRKVTSVIGICALAGGCLIGSALGFLLAKRASTWCVECGRTIATADGHATYPALREFREKGIHD